MASRVYNITNLDTWLAVEQHYNLSTLLAGVPHYPLDAVLASVQCYGLGTWLTDVEHLPSQWLTSGCTTLPPG
jgi:hypothetical protein